MKKLLMFLFAAFLVLGFAACNGEDTTEATTEASEFQVDGEFMAFEIGEHRGAPMITSVTVTVLDGEIVEYYIDALQSDDETFEWNEETKKELGDEYGMVERGGAVAEWYVQAEAIEDHWLENGYDSVEVDDENVITNVQIDEDTDVTIKDGGYIALAAEAVQQAKDGITKAYTVSMHYGAPQVVWATLDLDENGDIEDLTIDTLQSTVDEDTFTWDDESKQEKGYDYKMHYGTYEATDETPTMDEYITWLEDNNELEWFEQVDMITDYIVENGWETTFAVEDVDSLSDVSITVSSYESVLQAVFTKVQ
ncbi:MAG: hypothetical protein ACOCUD_02290 [Bacillota bacterium]